MSTQFNIDGSIYNQDQKYQIEGTVYTINTRFNPRGLPDVDGNVGGWYLSIYDQNRNPMLLGWKVVPNRVLKGFFNGWLACVDTDPSAGDQIVTQYNFGFDKRYQMVFFSEEEVQAFGG